MATKHEITTCARPALPDLRNLGTILRILLIVNALALVAAVLARAALVDALSSAWLAHGRPRRAATCCCSCCCSTCSRRGSSAWSTVWRRLLHHRLTLLVTLGLELVAGAASSICATESLLRHSLLFGARGSGALLSYFQLRAKALSPAITEARLQALQARIRPHFLFNSINAVLSLVRSEPRRAETALEDLADLFRVLMRDNRQLAPLGGRGRAVPPVPRPREAAPRRAAAASNGTSTSMPRRCAGAAAGAAAAARERRVSRHRAFERAGGDRDQHLPSPRRGARDPAQSVPAQAAAITAATRWRSPTSASASRCISTPRQASRAR